MPVGLPMPLVQDTAQVETSVDSSRHRLNLRTFENPDDISS